MVEYNKQDDKQAAKVIPVEPDQGQTFGGVSEEVAYEVSQKLIRLRLREVEDVFRSLSLKLADRKTLYSIGIQMGVLLAIDAVTAGQLEIRQIKRTEGTPTDGDDSSD
jgi:hypothetical protein